MKQNGKILAKYKKTQSKHVKNLQDKFEEQRSARRRAQERREMMDECHVIPDIVYNAKQEKIMRKTATYGVVALFKAVAKHQMDIKRSFDGIDAENDVLQKQTMKIEQRSTDRLLSSLNEASSKKGQLIQTPNPLKRRRLNDKSSKLPRHLQSVLVDKNEETDSNETESDSDIDQSGHKQKSNEWSVLNENMIFESNKSHKQEIMDQDSEFDDDFEDDSS